MALPPPSAETWTLRLKSRKTTVLLHVDPLHTFSTIKSHLYAALEQTGFSDPDTETLIPLPASPADIQLGRPVDPNDPRRGFMLGEWELPPVDDDNPPAADVGKGKGKAKAGRPSKGGVASARNCPKGADLKDGAVLAFRWKGDGNEWEDDEDLDPEVDRASGADAKKGVDMWGVKLASFEDSYGVEIEGDVGGGREFEG